MRGVLLCTVEPEKYCTLEGDSLIEKSDFSKNGDPTRSVTGLIRLELEKVEFAAPLIFNYQTNYLNLHNTYSTI